MHCWIYRSPRRDEMYLYLAREDDFDVLPETLLRGFGRPQAVMSLKLDEQRPLARARVTEVIDALREQGYFLQLPPKLRPALYFGD